MKFSHVILKDICKKKIFDFMDLGQGYVYFTICFGHYLLQSHDER